MSPHYEVIMAKAIRPHLEQTDRRDIVTSFKIALEVEKALEEGGYIIIPAEEHNTGTRNDYL